MSNGEASPKPVHTTIGADFHWFDQLPKAVRLFAIECLYDYDAKMIYDMYQKILRDEGYDLYAIGLTNQQLQLNDAHLFKEEMEKRWKSTSYSIPSKSSPLPSPTRLIARTASQSETLRSRRGAMRRIGRKTAPQPEFSLYGTTPQSPLSSPTRGGSA